MLELITILVQICLGIFFIRWLIKNDRGAKEPRQGIRAALGFGLLSLILVLFLNPLQTGIDIKTIHSQPLSTMLLAAFAIGIAEEVAKSVPLAIYLWRKPYFNETTDGLFYFGISGMVFGVIESILYTLTFGGATGLLRIITTPFLHAGFAMWFGYFLARRKILGKGTGMAILGLVLAISLHAIYNFGLFTKQPILSITSLLLGLSLNIGVFLLYRRAQREDAKLSLSADGTNKFCRSCGKPNPHHTLYCESCGQHT